MSITWALVGKGSIPHVATEAQKIAAALVERGQDVLVEESLAAPLSMPMHSMEQLDQQADIFITVGGDGTILHAQAATGKPVLGVNAGAIGFLAEVEPDEAPAAIDRIIAGDYVVEARHRLTAWLDGQELPDAVNEVTLQTSRIAKLIRIEVQVDGEELDVLRGDGIIVSTPTGSTGYAMSVGGPLIHPSVPAVVLAPIAPFKLAARPWVVHAGSTVCLKLLERDSAQGQQQARVVVDGQHGFDMETGAILEVRESKRKARFVRFGGGFYERVRTKLIR